jgi:hypothetical protein
LRSLGRMTKWDERSCEISQLRLQSVVKKGNVGYEGSKDEMKRSWKRSRGPLLGYKLKKISQERGAIDEG